MPKGRANSLSVTQVTYGEWQLAFDHFNRELFENKLPECLITFQREKKTMGYFSKSRFVNRHSRKVDEIALNPGYFALYGVNEALQTLAHEMTHQWQAHFGYSGRGRYHNKQWADRMESIGLMPSSTGRPGGRKTGDKMGDYIIQGGLFEQSIKRLKGKGFELIWMDSFVSSPLSNNEPHYLEAAQQLNIQIPVKDSIPDYEPLDTTDDNHQEDTPLVASIDDLEFSRVVQMQGERIVQKQGARMKYSCGCGVNIWGKPGIDVTCNQCERRFAMKTTEDTKV